MRAIHLYTGLFLGPWMLVYALSGFLLNHGPWVRELLSVTPPQWKLVRSTTIPPETRPEGTPREQAQTLLQYLDLDGPHHLAGQPTDDLVTIIRQSGGGNYRVLWHPAAGTATVQRQDPPSAVRFVHALHFRHGYAQPYFATLTWGLIVDAVVASMVFWVVSGIYLWARRPQPRRWGWLTLIGGGGLFVYLTVILYQ